MKRLMVLGGVCLALASAVSAENAYDFRRRLEVVHQADRRDPSARCAAEEFAFADGARIALLGKASEAVAVARDFEDYLRVSMDVEAAVTVRPESAGRYALMASLDEGLAAREKDEAGILSAARDEYANASAALALVEEDSHLGFEPDMDYVGGPEQIRWKLKLMEKLYGREAVAGK